ncbi:MAG: FtsB family cell division protein [Candidatus Acidiferrales bacterium]
MAVKIKTKRVAARRKPAKKTAKPTAARRASDFLRMHFWAILGLLMMAVLMHDVFGGRGFLAMRRQQQEVRKIQQAIEQISQENRELTDKVHRLKTDPQYIERLAREQMGLSRPGEHVFKLPPKEKTEPRPESAKRE